MVLFTAICNIDSYEKGQEQLAVIKEVNLPTQRCSIFQLLELDHTKEPYIQVSCCS